MNSPMCQVIHAIQTTPIKPKRNPNEKKTPMNRKMFQSISHVGQLLDQHHRHNEPKPQRTLQRPFSKINTPAIRTVTRLMKRNKVRSLQVCANSFITFYPSFWTKAARKQRLYLDCLFRPLVHSTITGIPFAILCINIDKISDYLDPESIQLLQPQRPRVSARPQHIPVPDEVLPSLKTIQT